MSKPEGVECRLTLLTGWEGIGLYALTFTMMTQNNFCSVIFPVELNTRSIPFPIVMLVLRVRYLRCKFNTCAAVIFATIRCLRYFESDFKSLKITSLTTVIVPSRHSLHCYVIIISVTDEIGENLIGVQLMNDYRLICGVKNEYYVTLFSQIIHSFFCS